VRACTPCIADAPHLFAITRRITDLGQRLSAMTGAMGRNGNEQLSGLEQALTCCETALEPLEKAYRDNLRSDASVSVMEVGLQSSRAGEMERL
jgi:hypothetical protein